MRVQLAWTMLAEVVVMVSGVLLLKLAADLLGPLGFGEYTLTRRAIGLMYLPLVLGLGIAAPRYIAIARAGALPGHSGRTFAAAALLVGMTPPVVAVFLLNASPATASLMLFGTTSLEHLVRPASLALAGIALHSMVYAVYRGRSEMSFANAMQVVSLGAVPVAVFLMVERNAAAVLEATGVAWIGVSTIALLALALREQHEDRGTAGIRDHLSLLIKFGLPRVPGEFALVGLFAIPALIAVRFDGVVSAGQFSAAMSLVTIFSGAFTPIGLVVLPKASAMAAIGDIPGVRSLTTRILIAGMLIAGVGVLLGEIAIPPLVAWYFGAAFLPAVPVFRVCLLAALPYVAYVLLRNVLDALDVRAVNSRNLLIALAMLLLLCLFRPTVMWMAASLVASMSLLGILTLRETWLRLQSPSPPPLAVAA